MPADELSAAAELPVLTSGFVLSGRFQLEDVAGHGGMSVVWRAKDLVLEHETALKFLPTILTGDKAALADLRREARRARDLAHPQICRVYDYGEDPSRHLAWISMEYLSGGSLSRQIKEQPRGFFEPADILPWFREICDALTYAHDIARVVHRDLKPANLLLDARGHIRITDFGIAQSISESFTRLTGAFSPAATTRTGSLYYMSPQQARGERARATDDLYSLGATIFELLTGQPPFMTGDLNWQREHAPPPKVGERRAQLGTDAPIPEAWETLLQRMLAKHPAHRPQTAREVAEAVCALSAAPPNEIQAPAVKESATTAPPSLPSSISLKTTRRSPKPQIPTTTPAPRAGLSIWIWALAGLVFLGIGLFLALRFIVE